MRVLLLACGLILSPGAWAQETLLGAALRSLPEYDGYASDLTQPGFYKDYHFPNNQPARSLWYHDHALGMTRLNVYAGPAGFYIVRGGPDVGDPRAGVAGSA